jgi:ABC-type Co2+ transport system permease subunit
MLTAVLTALFLSAAAALFISRRRQANLEDQIGWPLWGIVGGLIFYIYYALGLPGTAVLGTLGPWAGFIIALLGSLAGLFLYLARYHPFGNDSERSRGGP